jgi:hypothetical protein
MNLDTRAKLLKLKGILSEISHASFSYAQISKDYPIHALDEQKAQQLIKAYEDIVKTVNRSVKAYENTTS